MEANLTIDLSGIEDEVYKMVEKAIAKLLPAGVTSNNTREDDEMIDTKEACRILGCSTRTMQNYRDGRLFPFIKVGPHKAMYYRKDIEAFRDAHRIEAR